MSTYHSTVKLIFDALLLYLLFFLLKAAHGPCYQFKVSILRIRPITKLQKSHLCISLYEKKLNLREYIKKRTFSLKEMSDFSIFLAIVRQVPYYAQKSAKKSTFFKRKSAFYDVYFTTVIKFQFFSKMASCKAIYLVFLKKTRKKDRFLTIF